MQKMGKIVEKMTKRQAYALKLLRDNANKEDGEMVYEKGECWIGLEKFGRKTLFALLRLMALRIDSHSTIGGFEIYTINETGLNLFKEWEKTNV